jgi:hypothetical protein
MALHIFLEGLKNWVSISIEDNRCCQRSMVQVRCVIEDFNNDQYKIFEIMD